MKYSKLEYRHVSDDMKTIYCLSSRWKNMYSPRGNFYCSSTKSKRK